MARLLLIVAASVVVIGFVSGCKHKDANPNDPSIASQIQAPEGMNSSVSPAKTK
jgi:hypothetical protein